MQNSNSVENALENIYILFSLFSMKNFFCFEGCIIEVDVVDLKVPNV